MGRRKAALIALAVATPVLAAGVAYGVHFADHALPWTTVAGQSVVGQTRAQVEAGLRERVQAVEVTLHAGSATRTGSLVALGSPVDVTATVDAVFAPNASWGSRLLALVSRHDVLPVAGVDRTTTDEVVAALVAGSGEGGTDAAAVLAADGASYVVTPPVAGQTVDPTAYAAALDGAVRSLRSTDVTLPMVAATPAVTVAQAQQAADAANTIVGRTVSVSDGTDTHVATAADKAAWVVVTTGAGMPGSAGVDAAKVSAWVEQTAAATNVTVTDGIRVVDAEGSVMSVRQRPADGRTATNVDAVTSALVTALRSGTDYAGTFTYDTVAASWVEQQVSPGDLVYAAGAGEKWIDVNLTLHTMTAYEGSTVVRGPIAMVNGAKATPTVIGTFHIYSKVRTQTMRGDNADGTRYETPNVPWISYFYSGYALHGAPWRSSFGYAGSHGCINLPVSVAQWIYTWAPVGTAVVTHR